MKNTSYSYMTDGYKCQDCGAEYFENTETGKCPECGGKLEEGEISVST